MCDEDTESVDRPGSISYTYYEITVDRSTTLVYKPPVDFLGESGIDSNTLIKI